MRRLNNKGYMLVEIILAFVLAMTIMYFITELTIKVKNRNDDLLVRTLTATDQTIIYNIIMNEIYNGTFNKNLIECELIEGDSVIDSIKKKGYIFEYNDKKLILNDYVDSCAYVSANESIEIKVNQLPKENFDIVLPLKN